MSVLVRRHINKNYLNIQVDNYVNEKIFANIIIN